MTQVNWTKNLVLAVLLCVLGAFAYWLAFKHTPDETAATEAAKKPLVFKEGVKEFPIDSMKVVDPVTGTFALSCQNSAADGPCKSGGNSKWKLTAPMQVAADDTNANSLVSTLSMLSATDVFDLKDETPEKRAQLLKNYGLSKEERNAPNAKRAEVTLDKKLYVLHIGATHPINSGLFGMLGDDETKVYLFPSYLKSTFDHNLTYWRNKKIFTFSPSDIQSVDIQGTENLTATRLPEHRQDGDATKYDHGWTVSEKGVDYAGDSDAIDAVLNAATYVSAKEFAAENKSDPKAVAAVKDMKRILKIVFKKASENVTFELYEPAAKGGKAPAPALYAISSASDPLYELQTSSKTQFMKTLKDLRLSKLLTSMDRFEIKKIVFDGKPVENKPLTLESKDGKWTSENMSVASDKVQSTLDRLMGNKIHDFLNGKAYPSGEADGLKMTLSTAKDPDKRRFVFWKKDGKFFARDLGQPRAEAFLMDVTVADALPWSRSYYVAAPQPSPKK